LEIIYFLLIGSVAGWLAGQLMKGRGFGLFSNMVIGVLGAVLGGYLFRILGISKEPGALGVLVVSTFGAIVLLVIVGALKKA
jgi:uncharacterized membrane protein YeaQ/YmgE (transglycosylase-associated protein family)